MDRRGFNRMCSALVAGASALSLELANSPRASASDTGNDDKYPRSRLVSADGKPIKVTDLAEGSSHIFSYPYKTTPCFLLRLSKSSLDRDLQSLANGANATSNSEINAPGGIELATHNGQTYHWKGGVGPDSSVVAFSAICTHKMSHPARPVSHLNFRPEEKTLHFGNGNKVEARELIYCCSEHSTYDPAAGARVLSGPATQPLAAIELAVNDRDEIEAVGTYGSNMFEQFLEKFGFRQAMEQGISDPYESATKDVQVMRAEDYSTLQILC